MLPRVPPVAGTIWPVSISPVLPEVLIVSPSPERGARSPARQGEIPQATATHSALRRRSLSPGARIVSALSTSTSFTAPHGAPPAASRSCHSPPPCAVPHASVDSDLPPDSIATLTEYSPTIFATADEHECSLAPLTTAEEPDGAPANVDEHGCSLVSLATAEEPGCSPATIPPATVSQYNFIARAP